METYEAMRQFADSWALLAMVLFFLGVVARSLSARSETMRRCAALPLDERGPKDFADAAAEPERQSNKGEDQ